MAKVKICGISRKEDIASVNKYIPEYAGFVFAPSRRRVLPSQAAAITAGLDKRIKKVGVFVNGEIDEVVFNAGLCRLDVVQIHGDEPIYYFERLKEKLDSISGIEGLNGKIEIWKAVRVKDDTSLEGLADFDADAFVLDAYTEGSYGGAGKTFNWDLAVKAKKYGKIILAGGLKPDNALSARDYVQPYALDVSTGVETGGYKDDSKIRDFICIARSY